MKAQHHYGRIGDDGAILGVQTTPEPLDPPPSGWIKMPDGADKTTHYVVNGVLFPYPDDVASSLRAGPPFPGALWSVAKFGWVDHRTLAQAKTQKLSEINQAFQREASTLIAGYPQGETLTWGIQQSEALAWQANANAATPYLDGLADSRGIDRGQMRQKTLSKVLMFMETSRALVGTRQRLEDEVNAAQSIDQVSQISWPDS